MQLTARQEELLVKKYDRLVRGVVYRFKRRTNAHPGNWEDLYQEAMIVLFEALRKAPSLEAFRVPFRDMVNAMCRYTLYEQAVSVPKRTSDYTRRVNGGVPHKVDLAVLDWEDGPRDMMEDDVLFHLDFEGFVRTLSDEDRAILLLKMRGLSNREIGSRLGITDPTMTRRVRSLQEKYAAYAA